MSKSEFHLDFYIKVPSMKDTLEAEAESRLRELAEDHTDMVGAAVTVEELSHEETPHIYRARVVAYIRPEEIAAIEKADSPEAALDQALNALARQIRSKRDKMRQRWEHPDVLVRMDNIFERTPREIFDAYVADLTPEEVRDLDRDGIAADLMTKQGFSDQAAYYAADQILIYIEDTPNV